MPKRDELGAHEFTEIVISEVNVAGSTVIDGVFALRDASCVIFVEKSRMSRRVAELAEESTKINSCLCSVESCVLFGFCWRQRDDFLAF